MLHRRSIVRVFAALVAIAACLPWTARAVDAPAAADGPTVAGVKFERQLVLGGHPLQLNGAGVRYKFVIKVYAAGLYLTAPASTTEAVVASDTPRAMRIAMLRDIDANELGKLLTSGMEKNATRDEFGKAIPGIAKLGELFSARKKLRAGDSFTVEYLPGIGTQISVNGQPSIEPVKEPEFFNALLKIWLGDAPADAQLKQALLGAAR